MEINVFAPAKVNLHLAVKNKRDDGFHNLESVFLTVNFGDDIFFSSVSGGLGGVGHLADLNEDTLSMEPENTATGSPYSVIAKNDNIIMRALSLFREKTEFNQKFSIRVVKRIPIGGGLGGGSSDAASTLLALNKMAGSPLEIEQLLEIGAALGSDVPFFLRQTQAAWVTGRGEIIEPITVPKMFLVLVNPGFPSETGTAFRLLDKYRIRNSSRRDAETQRKSNDSSASFAPLRLCVSSFFNSFLPVFDDDVKTIYTKIISQLLDLGAQYANLSGAGSTCFGVFENSAQAQKAAEAMQHDWSFVTWCQSP